MAYEEKIFILGSTANIGKPLVNKLLSNPKVSVTLFARSPAKVQQLFGDDHAEGKITIVQGDYNDRAKVHKSIAGHTRMFLLISDPEFKGGMARYAQDFAETAYAAGVKQIVLISGIMAAMPWRSCSIAAQACEFEQVVLSVPNRGFAVTLRPAYFMSNLFLEAATIKGMNTFFATSDPNDTTCWISPNDIAEVAASILQDPVEKHGDAVYEMIGDPRSKKEQAEILTRLLGRDIVYQRITEAQSYNTMTQQVGMSHSLAYTFLQSASMLKNRKATPGLSILLGRPAETLEQWIKQNKAAFL